MSVAVCVVTQVRDEATRGKDDDREKKKKKAMHLRE